VAKKVKGAGSELHVQGEMTIYRAAELAQQVFTAVRERPDDTRLDLSQVTELDSAGMQILLMARRLAAAGGKRLQILNPSACVREVLTLCNLDEALGVAAGGSR
jgi:anti-sigma B factor antagonist